MYRQSCFSPHPQCYSMNTYYFLNQKYFLVIQLVKVATLTILLLFQSWPDYEDIYKKMIEVATFLDLPRFPDITEDCYLHPDILCMKYLMEVNLPGECGV